MQLHGLLLSYRPGGMEVSWPGWLIHSGHFTIKVVTGHMSTIDQAQIRESPPAKDQRPNH